MAANPLGEVMILGRPDAVEGKAVALPSHEAINAFSDEKHRVAIHDGEIDKGTLEPEIKAALPEYDAGGHDKDGDGEDHIIVTGADAAAYLLPMRDDFVPALTFRSMFLATILSGFQAVVYQIYQVSPHLQSLHTVNPDMRCSSNLL
jgi:hypothetical protein